MAACNYHGESLALVAGAPGVAPGLDTGSTGVASVPCRPGTLSISVAGLFLFRTVIFYPQRPHLGLKVSRFRNQSNQSRADLESVAELLLSWLSSRSELPPPGLGPGLPLPGGEPGGFRSGH